MPDNQWSIAVVVVALLLVGNALFLFMAKRKSSHRSIESQQNLNTAIRRSEVSSSPTSSSGTNPWQPERESAPAATSGGHTAPPLPPDITQPEALFLGITQLGPKHAPVSISKSPDCDA